MQTSGTNEIGAQIAASPDLLLDAKVVLIVVRGLERSTWEGAWYVLSAMGFYPVCPGEGIYILGSPLFPKVRLHLDKK